MKARAALFMAFLLAAAVVQGGPEDSPQYQQGYDDGYSDGSNDGYAQGYQDAYDAGFRNGQQSGYDNGYANGSADGYARGYQDAYGDGFGDGRAEGAAEGYNEGYADGYRDGAAEAYAQGFSDGHAIGYANGSADGYSVGYAEGQSDGYSQGFDAGFDAGYAQGFAEGRQNGGGPILDTTPAGPHPASACSIPYHIQWAGWDLCWQQDDLRVQGVEVNRAFFHGDSVVWKMGVPFSLTQYERPLGPGPFKDVLGRPHDAGRNGYGNGPMLIDPDACPRFLGQGELLNDGRLCVEYRGGVEPAMALWARYDVFNYRFIQGWQFDARGHMEPFLRLGGLLIEDAEAGEWGQDHMHHVYWRIDFDIAADGNDRFQAFKQTAAGDVFPLVVNNPLLETTRCDDPLDGIQGKTWCNISQEMGLQYVHHTLDKWRVMDSEDVNARGHERSFEFRIHSDAPADHFSTFDAMVLQYAGDSQEIGHEVPTNPSKVNGDGEVQAYAIPPEGITDPVVWLVYRVHHDTRDEDRGSMTYHDVRFDIQSKNFLDRNLGEATYP